MNPVVLVLAAALAVAVGVALFLALREAWVHYVYPLVAERMLEKGHPDLAAAVLERGLKLWRMVRVDVAPSRFRLAHVYYRAGRFTDAVELCEHLLTEAPQLSGQVQSLRGDCLDRLGRPDEAVAARELAGEAYLERDPNSLFARELAIDRLEATGDAFAALRELEQLIDGLTDSPQDPRDPAAFRDFLAALRTRLARMYGSLGHYEAAVATCELVLGRSSIPEGVRHDAHLAAGRAYLALESFAQAERDANDAFRIANLAVEPDKLIDDCLLLGELAVHQGAYAEAMKQFQRVRECSGPGRWLAWLSEAELLHLWGRDVEADRAGQRAADLVNDLGDPRGQQVVAVTRASHLWERDAAQAMALVRPWHDEPLPDVRFMARRAALTATLAAALDEDPAPYLAELDEPRARFAHDRHLLADLDDAEGEVARLQGRHADALVLFERGLQRPCARLLRPHFQLRLGQMAAALGRDDDACRWYAAAADFTMPLAAVLQARQAIR